MPKLKKANDLTADEVMRRVFTPEVLRSIKKLTKVKVRKKGEK